ncbi:helix-turn-helix transcriptional regulator [Candidatus Gracilibacteria bacterium]|nr:helix-turn-helix transcriptional regulator [Candidatus Gracilibacteria bacterium]
MTAPNGASPTRAAGANEVDLLVGSRIADARRSSGLSVRELARALGWPPSTLNNYETGRRPVPLDRLFAIAEALHQPPAAFLVATPEEAEVITAIAGDIEKCLQIRLVLAALDEPLPEEPTEELQSKSCQRGPGCIHASKDATSASVQSRSCRRGPNDRNVHRSPRLLTSRIVTAHAFKCGNRASYEAIEPTVRRYGPRAHGSIATDSRSRAVQTRSCFMTQRPRRRTQEELERVIFQRLLHHLTAMCPDLPLPLVFLNEMLENDLFVEDPPFNLELLDQAQPPCLSELLTRRPPVAVDVSELYDITGPDYARGVITVRPTQRVAIQELIRELQRSGQWIDALALQESDIIFTSTLYFLVSDRKADLAPDHLALLAAHGLYWLERAMSLPDAGNAYAALQRYAALWILVTREAVAAGELVPFLPQIMALAEQHGREWKDRFAVGFLASLGAAMAESGEPGLHAWIEQAFSIAERLIDTVDPDEQPVACRALRVARLRAGMEL